MQPRSKSEPRDTHALGTRPLVGGVSFPPQFVPMLLAVLVSSPPPAAAKTEAAPGLVLAMEVDPKAAEATEAMEAAAGAMEVAARSMEAAELGAGARSGSAEAADRRPTRESYEHGLHAPLPWCAPLPSVSLGPYLFFGLLLSCATTRPWLRGYDVSNSNPSRVRTGIGPKRRWLILGLLAVASGFRLPEDNGGVTQIGADVNPLSPHESTITGEVDGARDRRRLVSEGSSCNSAYDCNSAYMYDSPPRLCVPPLRNSCRCFLVRSDTAAVYHPPSSCGCDSWLFSCECDAGAWWTPAAAELEEVEVKAEADAAEAVTATAAAATTEPVAAVEPEPKPIVAEAELRTVSGAGARAEEAGRRPKRRLYDHSLHVLFSPFALLSSVSLSPLLLLGLLLASAVSRAARTPRPLLHGCRARNSKVSKVSRTGIGPMRRWLILGWLAVASGFRLPEDNGAVAQIDAGVELAHGSLLSSHESTILGEVDGARNRRQLASGSSCDDDWCVSSRTPPPSPLPACPRLA